MCHYMDQHFLGVIKLVFTARKRGYIMYKILDSPNENIKCDIKHRFSTFEFLDQKIHQIDPKLHP